MSEAVGEQNEKVDRESKKEITRPDKIIFNKTCGRENRTTGEKNRRNEEKKKKRKPDEKERLKEETKKKRTEQKNRIEEQNRNRTIKSERKDCARGR